MTGNKRSLIALALLLAAIALPLLFLDLRTEDLHCRSLEPTKPNQLRISCRTDSEGLVWASRTYLSPPGTIEVWGLYARPGYSYITATIMGIALPLLLVGMCPLAAVGLMNRTGRKPVGDNL